MPCISQTTADSQCYVLSKSLQTPNAMYHPNYCRLPMLCIIQITADSQCQYYPNYCRPPNAMYYPNHCRLPMPCISQITADSQCHVLPKLLQTQMQCIIQITAYSQFHVLSKLLQTPMLCIIQITADSQCHVLSKLLQAHNAMYYPNYWKPPVLCILHITDSYTLIQYRWPHNRYVQPRPLHFASTSWSYFTECIKMPPFLWAACLDDSSSDCAA
jgi:hypothetical protein